MGLAERASLGVFQSPRDLACPFRFSHTQLDPSRLQGICRCSRAGTEHTAQHSRGQDRPDWTGALPGWLALICCTSSTPFPFPFHQELAAAKAARKAQEAETKEERAAERAMEARARKAAAAAAAAEKAAAFGELLAWGF